MRITIPIIWRSASSRGSLVLIPVFGEPAGPRWSRFDWALLLHTVHAFVPFVADRPGRPVVGLLPKLRPLAANVDDNTP